MLKYAHIVGWGMYVPGKVVTNDDLAEMIDTSDEWIQSRTGIRERRVVDEQETTATMAIQAAREALDRARLTPASVGLIIVATSTPEHVFPSTACLVQDALGIPHAGAFDLSAACSGFIYALSMASAAVRSGSTEVALVIGSETLSRVLDWSDRNTCVLFGDGAGAVVLQASGEPGGVLSTVLGADGSGANDLIIPSGGSKSPASFETVAEGGHFIKMNGRAVFRFASRVVGRAALEACEKANLSVDDIDLFVPHQANDRIIKSATKYLKIGQEKVFVNLDRYGNTSTASIPIALCEAIAQGRVKRNDHLVLVGFGGGLTWGATVVQWGVPMPYKRRQWWYRMLRWALYQYAGLRSRLVRTVRGIEDIFSSDWRGNGQVPSEPEEEFSHDDQREPVRENGHLDNGQGLEEFVQEDVELEQVEQHRN
ncbi:MAG: beta-ketoacyl-ACP synthase III [Anaerolineae bacterium]